MFNYIKKEKKYRFLKPLGKESKTILDESRFSYPEDRNSYAETEGMVSYIRKSYAKRSIMSLFLSAAGFVFLFIAVRLTVALKGNTDMTVAALAASSMLFAGTGLWYGIISFLEKDVKYLLAYMGIALGGGQFVLWIMIILMGGRG